ncbi:hypothetical protein C7B65_11645 [Phormidesmis priestleyi ULC007]|uniref:Uncharacterized protein n=1 Tax=Phormidesmis priestleyi ULC007 TaxID=1920490 RepID=A0A2T1DFJ0_9CYAN|nr:hypothetical protein [Phormidesmis priestleyi]PSB19225.1 hypothetical protein C7B65_11645 [Phormidesmis priestleyi ULC007]PZO48180.1 MAG: hypothetical protein DCF14_17765 [Phormidesmis priestleyi]
MPSSDEYKRQVMHDLAKGDKESADDIIPDDSVENYQNFDDFAQRSSKEERRQLFGKSFHPDRIPSSQMEPELQKAIAQIKPNERNDVAKEFFSQLKKRGLHDRDLERQLGLTTHNPGHMTADDVSKLAAFTYHNHPDIFQEVLADQPAMMKFLSNPMVGAALGAIAAKWFGGHK